MLAQEIGCVVLWVKREGNQADLACTPGECAEPLGQLGELLIHERAKIGYRTSRINKRKCDHVAAKVGKLHNLAVLVGHGEIGDGLTDLEALWLLTQNGCFFRVIG